MLAAVGKAETVTHRARPCAAAMAAAAAAAAAAEDAKPSSRKAGYAEARKNSRQQKKDEERRRRSKRIAGARRCRRLSVVRGFARHASAMSAHARCGWVPRVPRRLEAQWPACMGAWGALDREDPCAGEELSDDDDDDDDDEDDDKADAVVPDTPSAQQDQTGAVPLVRIQNGTHPPAPTA